MSVVLKMTKSLLSPSADAELIALMQGDERQACKVRRCIARGEIVVIERSGQPLLEQNLKRFVAKHGGVAILIDNPIKFEVPHLGRGGEVYRR